MVDNKADHLVLLCERNVAHLDIAERLQESGHDLLLDRHNRKVAASSEVLAHEGRKVRGLLQDRSQILGHPLHTGCLTHLFGQVGKIIALLPFQHRDGFVHGSLDQGTGKVFAATLGRYAEKLLARPVAVGLH
ncbi:hypothetical protein SDC9_76711 [bioreactor metagenome]|uniref:Uncharacterized protein n=1 Tax=bioreactor metagenome TaxID=1076179 RepID=A0A644YNS9_9ZZZZ